MIKINITNPSDLERDYLAKVLNSVRERIEAFKITLSHLQRGSINIHHPKMEFVKLSSRNAINIIENLSLTEDPHFFKHNYQNTLNKFLTSNKKLNSVNILGLDNLVDFLLNNENDELIKLMICKPENLKTKNDFLLKKFNLTSCVEIALLKVIFSYGNYSSISGKIKEFFRTNNHVKICPYCNIEKVKHIPTPFGGIARHHELDHFFDQAKHSLLSCSMYNLIPSDSICNGSSNKGSTLFDDDEYLNPYISGFQNSISFRPEILPQYKVKKIILEIREPNNVRLKQLVGKAGRKDESSRKGNINVFRLESKYNDCNDDSSNTLIKIRNNSNNIFSLEKFTALMHLQHSKKAYLLWYKTYIGTPFNKEKFGEKAYSKLNRDLHDYYYKNNKGLIDNHIRELIKEDTIYEG